jgi:hypothetical protein
MTGVAFFASCSALCLGAGLSVAAGARGTRTAGAGTRRARGSLWGCVLPNGHGAAQTGSRWHVTARPTPNPTKLVDELDGVLGRLAHNPNFQPRTVCGAFCLRGPYFRISACAVALARITRGSQIGSEGTAWEAEGGRGVLLPAAKAAVASYWAWEAHTSPARGCQQVDEAKARAKAIWAGWG